MVVVMAPLPGGDTSRPEGNVLASIGGQSITSADLDQMIRDRFKNSPMGFDRHMVPMVAPSVLNQMVSGRGINPAGRQDGHSGFRSGSRANASSAFRGFIRREILLARSVRRKWSRSRPGNHGRNLKSCCAEICSKKRFEAL